MLLSEDVVKDRAIHADTRSAVAAAFAALQGSVSGEEQARPQLAASTNRTRAAWLKTWLTLHAAAYRRGC